MVENVYTAEGAAAILMKSTLQTVHRYLVAGKIKGFTVGRDWPITETDLHTFIEGSRPEADGSGQET
ncbi:MAG: helix-turn-helix domain-containing protein [Actinobacteria bacterium]|nr:helix-turn-helix domain-containing protein [Actinomycetota bacterium]